MKRMLGVLILSGLAGCTFERTVAQWRTLEAGGRIGRVWSVSLLTLSENPVFKRECLFNMARSMLDHGKYLCAYSAGHGNWLQVESSGLVCATLLFPEFKLSPHFYQVAMKGSRGQMPGRFCRTASSRNVQPRTITFR